MDINDGKFTFEEAVTVLSQDKDTRNNRGRMVNPTTGSTRFEMAQLPQEISRLVNDMQPGDISQPFIMTDPKTNREKVAFVKLTSRIPGHRANISDDYQLVKDMYENSRREEVLNTWLAKKSKTPTSASKTAGKTATSNTTGTSSSDETLTFTGTRGARNSQPARHARTGPERRPLGQVSGA